MTNAGRDRWRVAIADPQRLFRAGLRALLEAMPGVVVAGEADDVAGLEVVAATGPVDLYVLDPALPGDVPEFLRALRASRPGAGILVLAGEASRASIGGAIAAGAGGFVSKHDDAQTLRAAVARLLRGELFVSDALAPIFDAGEEAILVPLDLHRWALDPAEDGGEAEQVPNGPDAVDPARLTTREREILALVAQGANSAEIGAHLHISVQTVRKHRENLRRKVGAHNTAQITAYAIRIGLLGGT
jgi:DNA-binding NarL/FixJ family response regulator